MHSDNAEAASSRRGVAFREAPCRVAAARGYPGRGFGYGAAGASPNGQDY